VYCLFFHNLIIFQLGLIGNNLLLNKSLNCISVFFFFFSSFRLEQTFIESSQNYYANEIRTVRKHKESLNNITHQLLHIRHQFKIGFFSELKQDANSAVKSYKSAYAYLTENARIHDTNILEMKMVAGFLTNKVNR